MKKLLLLLALIAITNFNLFAVVPDKKDTNKDDGSRQIMEDNKIIFKLKSKIDLENGKLNKKQSAKNPNSITGIESVDKILSTAGANNLSQSFNTNNVTTNKKIASTQSQKLKNELSQIYEITLPKNGKLLSTIEKLKKDPNVTYAQPKYIYRTLGDPNDEMYNVQHHLPQIMASQAWSVHKGEDGTEEIIIGINDSGVDWNHPDLIDNLYINWNEVTNTNVDLFISNGDRLVLNPDAIDGFDTDGNGYTDDVIGWNFVTWDGSEPNDPMVWGGNAHGTHVAGLANGTTNNDIGISGMAYNVKFMATKHGANDGSNGIYDGFSGIVYLAENGADVINCSWGGTYYDYQGADVIAYANSLGSIVVAAAGNSNQYETAFSPAVLPGVIAVSSVAPNDAKSYYTTTSAYVDVAAPGGDRRYDPSEGALLSTLPGGTYGRFNGTSMASPLTAGLVALMKSKEPFLSNEELTRRLIATTDDISTQVGSDYLEMGSGRINALKALTRPDLQMNETLELVSQNYFITNDDNQDGVANTNETITISLNVRNYTHIYELEDVQFKLVSSNPQITAPRGVFAIANVPADGFFTIEGLELEIGNDLEPGFYTISLESINTNITANSRLDFEIMVLDSEKPTIFVLKPVIDGSSPYQNGNDLSEDFIKEYYGDRGYAIIARTTAPSAEILVQYFAATFATFGCASEGYSYIPNLDFNSLINILISLEYGNKVYLDGGSLQFNIAANFGPEINLYYLGTNYNYIWSAGLAPVTSLFAPDNTLLDNNTLFKSSNQINNMEIDFFEGDPNFGGTTFLTQNGTYFDWNSNELVSGDFGRAVYCDGMFGQKVVSSSYALGQLNDGNCPSHREQIFNRISLFLGLDVIEELCVDRPTRQTKNIRFRMIGKNRLGLTWTNGNGANRVVVASTSALNDAEYLKDNTFYMQGNYGTTQSEVPGTFVTYVGNQARADINGLTNNTLYHCRVFEVNHNGMFNKYLLSSEQGNPANRSTLKKESNEDEITESQFINVYPNPTTDFINIDLKVPFELENISIYDELGKEVYTSNNLENNQINVSSFSNGNYQIVINGQDQFIFNSFIILK